MNQSHQSGPAYPVVLNLTDRLVVIVGAGRVGRRKLEGVLKAGAQVRVVDPALAAESDHPHVTHLPRPYQSGDLLGASLVFACTDDPKTNRAVASEAAERSIWCCRSDQPEQNDFILPAVLQRDKLLIAVSSKGSSPAMTALLRDKLAETVSDSWGTAIEIIAAIRRKWLTEHSQVQYNQEVLHNLLDQEFISLIAHKQIKKIDQLLLAHFGPGFSLTELQVQIDKGRP